jgi:hypothetical protein
LCGRIWGKWAAEKIGKFFAAEYDDLKTLKFAILLLYAYTPSCTFHNDKHDFGEF